MTEQEITQARSDVDQLDIEQLRCGVLLQLLHIEQLTKERDELRLQIDIQAGSIEAVQAANQRLAANHKECVRCLGEALQDATNSAIERDALAAARYAYASEFALDKEGQPDVGSIHQNIRALKAAAKLALDAIVELRYSNSTHAAVTISDKAITKLLLAGVQ